MSANKAKNTTPEITLRKALWNSGLRGYRLHYKRVPGRPDISYVSKKLAIFVHGCFWHRCPTCSYGLPRTNSDYWKNKFERNVQRDRQHLTELESLGWQVIIAWECDIKRSSEEIAERIASKIQLILATQVRRP